MFLDYLKERRVKVETIPEVRRVATCALCHAEIYFNVAGWTSEDFDLERRYHDALLNATPEESAELYAQLNKRFDELGMALYGSHYAAALAASAAIITDWWNRGVGDLSDEELLAVIGGPLWAEA